jgi:hypothetical protein
MVGGGLPIGHRKTRGAILRLCRSVDEIAAGDQPDRVEE